jgi:hypothetical protein
MKGRNYEGHSALEICQDRRLAIRLGLHVLRRAKETCHGGPRVWLQSYAAGGCSVHSSSSRDACAAFERVGQKHLLGISCTSAGPVMTRPTESSPAIAGPKAHPGTQTPTVVAPTTPTPPNSLVPAWLREAAQSS